MELNIKNLYLVALIAAVALAAVLISRDTPTDTLGSVDRSHEYIATSTAGSSAFGAFTSGRLINTGAGALGSVVITGANTGVINFYDATTTNVNFRTGQAATSTIHIASIPASLAAGTYTFDAAYSDGLYIDIVSGTAPTTTITFR